VTIAARLSALSSRHSGAVFCERFYELTITDDPDLLLVQKLPQFRRSQQTPLLLASIEQSRAGGA
jgi:hypothetical protein